MSKINSKKIQLKLKKNIDIKPKIINIRKPINKIMNLNNFINFDKSFNSPKENTKFSYVFFKQSYISPTVTFFNNNYRKSSDKASPSPSKLLINNSTPISKANKRTFSNILSLKKNVIKSDAVKDSNNQKKFNIKTAKDKPLINEKKINSMKFLNKTNIINIDLKLNSNM